MSDDVVKVTGGVLHTEHGPLPLTVTFTYTLADPVAVSMTLLAEFEGKCGDMFTQQTTWVYARDLIDTALSTFLYTGNGDVAVDFVAIQDVLRFELTDVHGKKHNMFVDAEPVIEFLAESFALAPNPEESFDVDAAIQQLLDGSWSE